MNIKLEDIIKKYPTNINPESMSNKLKNTILIGDNIKEKGYFTDKNITIEDIKEPTHKTEEKWEEYTYTFQDYTLTIRFEPHNYRSMEIIFSKPTPEYEKNPITEFRFDYKGDERGVKY